MSAAAQPVTQPFTFSLIPTDLPHVHHGIAEWGDYDGDGDLDVLLSGIAGSQIITSLYRNEGKVGLGPTSMVDSTVVLTMDASLEPLAYSRAAWGDFDRDGDLDLVMQGSRTTVVPYEPATLLYRNDGGVLKLAADVELPGLHSGVVEWADVDNDGDLDLLIMGEAADHSRRTFLYLNDGQGAFVDSPHDLPGLAYGDASFADFDGDGDLDLALSGVGEDGLVAGLFINNGGKFARHASQLDAVAYASVQWGDYDADGDQDLVIAGGRISPFGFEGSTQLFRNDNQSLQKVESIFSNALAGSAAWGDYDNDGDLDLMLMGMDETFGRRIARLYENEGGSSFRLVTYLAGGYFASADWGDLEGDGDLDLLSTGRFSPDASVTNVYENKRQVVPPAQPPPQSLRADVRDDQVVLNWTPEGGLVQSYNLRVGTRSGASDVMSAHADPYTSRRLLSGVGNAGSLPHWYLRGLQAGTYFWSVQTLDAAFQASEFSSEGTFIVDAVVTSTDEHELPNAFRVHQNFPNPFSTTTLMRIDLPTAAHLRVDVFDLLGRKVAGIFDERVAAGRHAVTWNGRVRESDTLVSGVYLYQVRAGEHLSIGRMIIVR